MKTFIISQTDVTGSAGIRAGWRKSSAGFLVALCLAWPVLSVQAAPNSFKENEEKAAFLYNFAQYVDWPQEAFPEAATPLTIGILGDDDFADIVEQTVKGESVKGRSLVIKRFHSRAEITACHVLFVSRAEESRLKDLSGQLNTAGVLTVGECRGFPSAGGVINLYLQGNKIRFEINPELARRKGLKISAQLLCLGRIVETDTTKEGR